MPGAEGVSPTFLADGRTLATGAEDGAILLWDLASDAPPRRIDAGLERPHTLRLAAGGATLLATGASDVVRVDLGTGTVVHLAGHQGVVRELIVAADGRRFATEAETLRVWTIDGLVSWSLGTGTMAVMLRPAEVVALGSNGIGVWRDELPAEPAALAAWLDEQPYTLRPGGGTALSAGVLGDQR